MKHLKQKYVFIMILLVASLLIGCAQNTQLQSTETETAKPSLDVWIFFDLNTPGTHYLDMWKELGQKYGYNITVKTFSTQELKDKLRISLACDELPDIFSVWGGTFPDFLIDAGACLPVQDAIQASGIPFKASYTQPYKDGNNYIIPCLVEAYAVTFCNTALMSQVGVTTPQTWEELLDFVQKVNDYNLANHTDYAAIELGDKDSWLGELLYCMIVNRMDPKALDKLTNGQLHFTDPIFLDAANKVVQLVDSGAFASDYLETGEVESIGNFVNGQALLFPHQSTITYYLLEKMGKNAFQVKQFPDCENVFDPDYAKNLIDINHTMTPGLCINSKTQYPMEAKKLCLAFAKEVNKINVEDYGYLNITNDTSLVPPKDLPRPVMQFTSMVNQAKHMTSLWFSLLQEKDANNWRSLTKKLFAKAITPEEFIQEGQKYLNFTGQ